MIDLSRIHSYYRVAQQSKQVFDKLLSFFQRVRIELQIILRFQRSPSTWLTTKILLQYLQLGFQSVDDLGEQAGIREYVRSFCDCFEDEKSCFLTDQIDFVYALSRLDSNQVHKWLNYLYIKGRGHFASFELNQVLQVEQVVEQESLALVMI